MKDLHGKVAVVTGGGGGIGRAMGQRFAEQGMKVVLADVQAEPLQLAVKELEAEGYEAIGVVTDVTHQESVNALRDATYERFGAAHLVCNNAGIGAGAEGRLWEHDPQDWRWAIGVNLNGVIHGINAFVPAMIAGGEEGHIVNTSSGNGGVSPLSGTPQYAVTKAAVVTLTECLEAQLLDAGTNLRASVLFPGPHMLRTGIFESWKSRTDEFAKQTARKTPYTSVEDLEKQMQAAGIEIAYTDPLEVADQVVSAVKDQRFWILPESESSDFQLTARYQSMLNRSNPDYLRKVPG